MKNLFQVINIFKGLYKVRQQNLTHFKLRKRDKNLRGTGTFIVSYQSQKVTI